jgi:hypothetical protein
MGNRQTVDIVAVMFGNGDDNWHHAGFLRAAEITHVMAYLEIKGASNDAVLQALAALQNDKRYGVTKYVFDSSKKLTEVYFENNQSSTLANAVCGKLQELLAAGTQKND